MNKIIGHAIVHKKVCECSSMDWAKEHVSVVADGTIFIADKYRVARGRQGRIWKIYPGQLIVTFVLKPDISHVHDVDFAYKYLNMAITLGIADVLQPYDVKIKQPNDFMLQRKKLGGILIETAWMNGKIEGVVVGFSINCNNVFKSDDELYERAISLKSVLDKKVDISILRDALLLSIDKRYKSWKNSDFVAIFSDWKDNLIDFSNNVSVLL